jgi:DNA-binding XRE family transcriptional regulator
MSDAHKRLKEARLKFFEDAAEAARAMGIAKPTYYQHEDGRRGLTRHSARRYADKFKVNVDWLLYNKGARDRTPLNDFDDLPEEGQQLVAEYIEMIRQRYRKRGS